MSALDRIVHAYPVASFVVIAFAISWIAFIPFYWAGGEAIAWFTFGPFLAAIICSAALGGWPEIRRLLAPVVHWRVNPIWYLIAIGLPITAQLLATWLNPVLGAVAPNWANMPGPSQIAVVVAILLVFSGPLGEEPGWRGFALPRLLDDHAALKASVILGLVWAAWHLPLALLGELSLFGSIHAIIAAVVFTWLWQNTRSVLMAILMHASHQNSARFLGQVYDDADRVQQQWICVALWLLVAIAILTLCGSRSFRHGERRRTLASSPD